MGHEFIGVVDAVGADVETVDVGDLVVSEELLPDVLEGRIEPGRVFDRTGSIEDVPDGYRAMNEREVLKFEIRP